LLDPGDNGLGYSHDLLVDHVGKGDQEVLDKIHVLLYLNRHDALLDQVHELGKDILLLKTRDKVVVTGDSF